MAEAPNPPRPYPPSPAARLERAKSLTNQAMWTVYLQYRRLSRREPEDEEFVMRWWADLEFFLVALGRLERSVAIALTVPEVRGQVRAALEVFRKALPAIRMLRDVGEHIDAYAVDDPRRHHPGMSRRVLQVGIGGPGESLVDWRGQRIDLPAALRCAEALDEAVKQAVRDHLAHKRG